MPIGQSITTVRFDSLCRILSQAHMLNENYLTTPTISLKCVYPINIFTFFNWSLTVSIRLAVRFSKTNKWEYCRNFERSTHPVNRVRVDCTEKSWMRALLNQSCNVPAWKRWSLDKTSCHFGAKDLAEKGPSARLSRRRGTVKNVRTTRFRLVRPKYAVYCSAIQIWFSVARSNSAHPAKTPHKTKEVWKFHAALLFPTSDPISEIVENTFTHHVIVHKFLHLFHQTTY